MGYRICNQINYARHKRRSTHIWADISRNESLKNTDSYGIIVIPSIGFGSSIRNFKKNEELPLTNGDLSGNLVIDNLYQGSIKANFRHKSWRTRQAVWRAEQSEDPCTIRFAQVHGHEPERSEWFMGKAVHAVPYGTGSAGYRKSELRLKSRQFAWVFFCSFT